MKTSGRRRMPMSVVKCRRHALTKTVRCYRWGCDMSGHVAHTPPVQGLLFVSSRLEGRLDVDNLSYAIFPRATMTRLKLTGTSCCAIEKPISTMVQYCAESDTILPRCSNSRRTLPARHFTQQAAAAGEGLARAVIADGNSDEAAPVVPLLVWLMRLIVQPRVTASDSHFSGLLSLARVLVGQLGTHGKKELGLWGLQRLAVPPAGGAGGVVRGSQRDGGEDVREGGEDAVAGRDKGLLYYVYHDCLFDIATSQNHGPLAPPKCRLVCFCCYRPSFHVVPYSLDAGLIAGFRESGFPVCTPCCTWWWLFLVGYGGVRLCC